MRYIFGKFFFIIIIVIATFATLVNFRSNSFKIEKSIIIKAPVDKIFPLINNQHNWKDWSPWVEIDPKMQLSFNGPDQGVGSVYLWDGNYKVGSGISTITEVNQNKYLKFRLDLERPIKTQHIAEFIFFEEKGETLVIWKMSGYENFMQKAASLIFNYNEMIDKYFDKGLNNIKTIVERK